MAELTTDPEDPRLGHGSDAEPRSQHEVYLVLSEEERAKDFARPYRSEYAHMECPRYPPDRFARESLRSLAVTTMGRVLSETYARQPDFYGATYCCHCKMHKPVSEFIWTADGTIVGS